MFSPAFEIAKASSAVVALLGNPPRFYSFGNAEQDGSKPYAVHQTIAGSPENYLRKLPDQDTLIVQVDVYCSTAAGGPNKAKEVTEALVEAFQEAAYVTSWNGEFRDPETKLWRISFTVEFMTPR